MEGQSNKQTNCYRRLALVAIQSRVTYCQRGARKSLNKSMPDYVEFEPQFQQALWGGRKLARLPGAPAEGPISEAWMVSDVAGRSSRTARGPHAGESLHDMLPTLGSFSRFPLLVKL